MSGRIKLYYKPGSCALAVHIALIWAGAEYEIEQVELGSSEYKKINPLGSVPALLYYNKIMTEAGSLLKFIANKYKEKNLLGSKDYETIQEVDQWLSFLGTELHKGYSQIFAPSRFTTKTDEVSLESVKQAAVNRLKFVYSIIEQHLEGKKFMVTNQKTIVDPYLYVMNTWMPATNILKLTDYPNMQKHFNVIAEDLAVIRARKEQGI